MKFFGRRSFTLISAGLVAALLSACGNSKPPEVVDREEERFNKYGSIFGEEGLSFSTANKGGGNDSGTGLAVNAFLWRASLDTISFMPISQADPFGGIIITDWHSTADNPNERYKLNVFILGRQLEANALRVSIFKQRVDAQGNWIKLNVDKDTAIKVEDSILTRAREMRIASLNQPEN